MNRILHICFFVSSLAVVGKATSADFLPETPPIKVLSDTIAPVIFCPGSQIINLAPSRCDTILHYMVTGFDDQGQVILIQLEGIASGGAFPSGATVNTWLATDLSGNTATCSFTITTFEPTTQPLCHPQTTIKLDQNCAKTLKASEILEGGPYGCPIHYIVEVDKTVPFGNGPWLVANFGINDLNMQYQVRVTSLLTNAKCYGNITIRDSLPPTLTCQNINVPCAIPESQLTPAFLRDSFGITYAVPAVSDACSGSMITMSFVDAFQDLPCNDTSLVSGIISRIWTATDANGNSSTCEQVIRRNRVLANVQIPTSKTTQCDNLNLSVATNGFPYVQFTSRRYEITPTSFCEFDVQFIDTIQPGNCAGNYTVRRTWNIFDACRPPSATNPKIGVQLIGVIDNKGPVMQCPADQIITMVDNNCRASVDLPDLFLSDHCSALASVEASWMDSGMPKTMSGTIQLEADSAGVHTLGMLGTVASFPIGTTNMVYAATDSCGNSSQCSFNLTLANTTPPIVQCDTLLLVGLPTNGYLNIPAAVLDNGSTDDCSPLVFKAKLTETNACHLEGLFSDTIHVCCHNSGDTLHGTLRVYDIAVPQGPVANNYGTGHYTDCAFRIRVSGSNPPSCVAPPDITISCEAFDPTLESYGGLLSQSCSVDSVSYLVSLTNFDTACSRGTITRLFKAFSSNGQMAQCSQKIVVNYNQEYFIRFPDDIISTTCDTSGAYGAPTFFGQDCELLYATHEDAQFNVVPDACFKIERTWKIINWCTYDPNLPIITVPNPSPNPITNHADNLPGPVVSNIQNMVDPWHSTIVKINPTDPVATNFSLYFNPNANGYQYKQIIKIIDTQKPLIENCSSDTMLVQDMSTNDPLFWNASYWLDPILVSTDLCESTTDLSITAYDGCSGGNVTITYQLLLDLNGDNIRETVINSTNLPPVNTVYYNNGSGGQGEARQFDFRSVAADQKYRFAFQEVIEGNKKTAYVRFNTTGSPNNFALPQLPYGTHKIRWFVTDACGNETTCERTFTIRDGKAPTVACLTGLTANILPTKTITLMTNFFLQFAQDNCTPTQYLSYGLRKAGTGTGFPLNMNGTPVNTVVFTCDEIGPQPVELWCRDKYNNAAFCQTNVVITDNSGNCAPTPPLTVSGHIKNELNVGIGGVGISLNGDAAFTPPFPFYEITDTTGLYAVTNSIPPTASFTIIPELDENPLNGVTTYDLVLISKNILGIQPLGSPFKLIAADANKSNTVTTFDVVEFRKLILGIYQTLPGNTSWRFVQRSFLFPNPLNPFQPPFPENISVDGLLGNMTNGDFIGVKIGDVNNTAVTGANAPAEDRTAGTQYFNVSAKGQETVQKGEEFDVSFTSSEPLLGCQFTLNFNGLEVLDIVPGANVGREHFGLFTEEKALTMAWEKGGVASFVLKCKALEAGSLREMFSIGSRITKAEGYQDNAGQPVQRFDLALRFPGMNTFALLQNQPNPFAGATDIAFNLPEASEATLKIFDANGRVLFKQSGEYEQGTHTITLEKSALDAVGVLYYQLETPKNSGLRKMVKL